VSARREKCGERKAHEAKNARREKCRKEKKEERRKIPVVHQLESAIRRHEREKFIVFPSLVTHTRVERHVIHDVWVVETQCEVWHS
jgi:hypothetical protein